MSHFSGVQMDKQTDKVNEIQWMTYKDHEPDKLCVGPFPSFPCDDVPLLWRTHDDLGRIYLLLGQLVVSCQLFNLDTIRLESLLNKFI